MAPHHPAEWTRHGDTTDGANSYRMLTTAPTLVTDGVPVPPNLRDTLGILDLTASGAAGAFSASVIIWGYKPSVAIYLSGVKTAVAGAAGWTQLGTIAFSGAVSGAESHQIEGLSAYTRVAVQATSVVGAPNLWGDFGFSPHLDE